jgi:hypothetical protein
MLRTIFSILLIGSVYPLPVEAENGPVEPFTVRNMNPFTLIHGLPVASSSHLLAGNESHLHLTGDVANNSIQSDSANERIRLDGETYRLALIWKWGITDDWQIGFELPYLSHYSGKMDGLIENWHDIFDLSNADREDWPRNRLVYRYENGDGEQVLVNRNRDGIGDLVVSLSHVLARDDDNPSRLALHASLKLPTGDPDEMLGSGAVDLAFWISGWERQKVWRWPLEIYGQAGVLFKGEADLLQDLQQDVVAFATLGLGWRANGWLDLKAQVDAHTSHYHSDLDQLGGAALLLTVGGSVHLDGDTRRIDISIGENLTTDTVPDFMINLAYLHKYDF